MTNSYFDDKRIFQYRIIPAKKIVFSEETAKACAANVCGKYGTCWTCPPGVGEWRELEKKIKSYANAAVFSCKYELEDSFDFESMRKGGKSTRKVLAEITERMHNDDIEFMALGVESCDLCEKCTYPEKPCRFPDKAVPSVEACGIDVVTLSKNIGINYSNGTNTVTYFCIILTDAHIE